MAVAHRCPGVGMDGGILGLEDRSLLKATFVLFPDLVEISTANNINRKVPENAYQTKFYGIRIF